MNDAHSFWLEARYQGLCAVCGSGGEFHAHHIVDKSLLKREHKDQHDPRNALRLCPTCHWSHEHAGPGKTEISLSQLPDQAICYAFEVLGIGAVVYLERHYVGEDGRVEAHLVGEGCHLCQA